MGISIHAGCFCVAKFILKISSRTFSAQLFEFQNGLPSISDCSCGVMSSDLNKIVISRPQ